MNYLTTPLDRHAELVSASTLPPARTACAEKWTLKQVQGDEFRYADEAQKLLAISLDGGVG
jgi:hypothetical protein